jgi:uncharacterized delta-60 repeat protein
MLQISRMRNVAALLLLLGMSLFCSPRVSATGSGKVDSAFNVNATNNLIATVRAVAVQPDGKLVIGGYFVAFNEGISLYLVRLNGDGTPDTAFNAQVRTDATVYTIVLQPDGKILISGLFTKVNGAPRSGIARLNSDGTLDPAFDSSTAQLYNVYGMALQSDGKIVITGGFIGPDGNYRASVARLQSDGSLDPSFDDSVTLDQQTMSIAVQPDGKVLVGSFNITVGEVTRFGIARLNDDGTLDAAFNPLMNESETAESFALQPDGKILVGGYFFSINGVNRFCLARLNADGSLDADFDSALNHEVLTINVQTDGKLLVGGYFTLPSDPTYTYGRIARLNSNGSLDSTFDTGMGADNAVRAIAVQANGRIIIGGAFKTFNGVGQSKLARLDGSGALEAAFNPAVVALGQINAVIAQPDGKLIVGGAFTKIAGVNRNFIARLNGDGTADASFNVGTGANSAVNALILQPDGKVLIAGTFSTVNGVRCYEVARLNADGTLDTSFNSTLPMSGGNFIYAMAQQSDGKVIIGGTFINNNYSPRINRLARLNSDGTLDGSFHPGSGPNSGVYALAAQPDGKVLVGGQFRTFSGANRNCLVRLNADGTPDSSFNMGIGADAGVAAPFVYAISLLPDGKILIGGYFISFNGVNQRYLARLNSDGSVDTSFNVASNIDSTVRAVAVLPDGKIMIGGDFNNINGISRPHVARLNSDGSLDASFNPGAGTETSVRAVAAQPDGKIVIGGTFTTANNAVHIGLARLLDDTTVAGDFDGDGKTDNSVWQSDTGGKWNIVNSADNSVRLQFWGQSILGDQAVPGDYDGDGKTEIAIYRPSEGNWYILKSSDGTGLLQNWGGPGDRPVPADYDGDGRTDLAVYRPSEGNWYVLQSSGGSSVQGWGDPSDKLVPGDYDGDGRADLAIWRPSDGNWYVRKSSGGLIQQNWGLSQDRPVPADYDGDGVTDFAVFRPSEGNWYIKQSGGGAVIRNWGLSTDRPVPGDYDGDSKADIAVWRPSEGTWYIIQSGTNTAVQQYLGGFSTDTPIPFAYLPQ